MWWCYLVLCARSSATDCPPVPATAMAGQRSTANATALAAREVAATLRRDAPAPGAAADVLRAVPIEGRLPSYITGTASRRPRLPDEEQARGARGVVAAAARRVRLDNVAYRFSAGTRGVMVVVPPGADGGHRQGQLPQCGALVPNPYFGPDLDAWDVAEDVVPFATRSSKALWRGNISSRPCDKDAGNRARLEACALSVERPDLFDAYCPHVNGCAPRDPDQCDAAGERLVAKSYGGDVFPHASTTESMRRAFRAPEKMARLRRASHPRPEVSLASAGRVHGQLQPQPQLVMEKGGRRLALAAAYAEFYFPL